MAVKLTRQGRIFFSVVGLLALVGFTLLWLNLQQNHNSVSQTPNYQTILPTGKTVGSLGGWRRVSPSTSSPAYAYTDKLSGVQIDVTEQPLPESFKTDTDSKLAELASTDKGYTKLDGNPAIFIGTSAKGPQSVIFVKNELLVMIKSTQTISNDAWKQYVASLR